MHSGWRDEAGGRVYLFFQALMASKFHSKPNVIQTSTTRTRKRKYSNQNVLPMTATDRHRPSPTVVVSGGRVRHTACEAACERDRMRDCMRDYKGDMKFNTSLLFTSLHYSTRTCSCPAPCSYMRSRHRGQSENASTCGRHVTRPRQDSWRVWPLYMRRAVVRRCSGVVVRGGVVRCGVVRCRCGAVWVGGVV